MAEPYLECLAHGAKYEDCGECASGGKKARFIIPLSTRRLTYSDLARSIGKAVVNG